MSSEEAQRFLDTYTHTQNTTLTENFHGAITFTLSRGGSCCCEVRLSVLVVVNNMAEGVVEMGWSWEGGGREGR